MVKAVQETIDLQKNSVSFFDEINQFLIEALNESFNIGQLSTSQRQAAIALIEKKDKDKRTIKNWRLIGDLFEN